MKKIAPNTLIKVKNINTDVLKTMILLFVVTLSFTSLGTTETYAQHYLFSVRKGGGPKGYGSIFRFNFADSSVTSLWDFKRSTGRYPSGLVSANDGKLYGVTQKGGLFDKGVLYQFDPITNIYTVKVNFSDLAAQTPVSIMLASNGKLYGILAHRKQTNRIFEYDPGTNVCSIIYNFIGSPQPGSLMEAADGYLYGVTRKGGPQRKGSIFKFDKITHTYTTLNTDFNGLRGLSPTGNLVEDDNGIFYGTTSDNKSPIKGRLYSYDPTTDIRRNRASSEAFLNSPVKFTDGNIYTISTTSASYPEIIQYNTTTHAATSVFTFSSNPLFGLTPTSNFIIGKDGKAYGNTIDGGVNNSGVIYQYDITNNVYVKMADYPITSNAFQIPGLCEVTINCPTIIANGPTRFCNGGDVDLSASSGANYLWSTGETTQTISISTSGNYQVTVDGEMACNPIQVIVNGLPFATITGSNTFCPGQSAFLSANTAAGYLWSNGETTQTLSTSAEGTYTVTVNNVSGCTRSKSIVVNKIIPKPENLTVGSIGSSYAYTNWDTEVCAMAYSIEYREVGGSWSVITIGGSVPGYQLTALAPATNYVCRVRSIYYDGTFSGFSALTYFTTLPLRTEETRIESVMKVYPNPASTVLNIDFLDLEKTAHIEVYNLIGKLVLAKEVNKGTATMQLDISTLINGVYTIKLHDNSQVMTSRFVKN